MLHSWKPERKEEAVSKCVKCAGRGTVPCKCCHGKGSHEVDGPPVIKEIVDFVTGGHECSDCCGDGYVTCPRCHGSGDD